MDSEGKQYIVFGGKWLRPIYLILFKLENSIDFI